MICGFLPIHISQDPYFSDLLSPSASFSPFAARTQQYVREQLGQADDKVLAFALWQHPQVFHEYFLNIWNIISFKTPFRSSLYLLPYPR